MMTTAPVYVGLGGNLPSRFGEPIQTCEAALTAMQARGLAIVRRSRWYKSAPVPPSDQPWFINGAVEVAGPAAADPVALLALLKGVERDFGRAAAARNAARIVDLDILAMGTLVRAEEPAVPHPRMHERAFVLLPLSEIAPAWTHPASGSSLADLVRLLPAGQHAEPVSA